ncbi:unnamed protein product [Malus baccata var. baccata]
MKIDEAVGVADGTRGVDAIVRDADGEFKGVVAMPTPPLLSVLAIELHAIKDVVCLAAEGVYVDVIRFLLQTNQVVVTHVLSEVYSVTPFKINTEPSWLTQSNHVESVNVG